MAQVMVHCPISSERSQQVGHHSPRVTVALVLIFFGRVPTVKVRMNPFVEDVRNLPAVGWSGLLKNG
jgi:hypothetical protein